MIGRLAGVAGVAVLLFSSSAWADFGDGMNAFRAGDYSQAVAEWMPLAEDGHAKAQNNVAYLYARGFGVSEDKITSKDWYIRAAEQGYAVAQYNLGRIYAKGLGVEKDHDTAFSWYLLAADQVHTRAQYIVATRYSKGLGVEKSLPHAYMWTTLALDRASGKLKKSIAALRGQLGDNMSPMEIAEALELARDHRLVMEDAPVGGVLASRVVKGTSSE